MGRRSNKENNHAPDTPLNIPQHEFEALARCLLPEIQRFFESEEGKREFEEWKREQKQNLKHKKAKT